MGDDDNIILDFFLLWDKRLNLH